jgi:hypothetical protein
VPDALAQSLPDALGAGPKLPGAFAVGNRRQALFGSDGSGDEAIGARHFLLWRAESASVSPLSQKCAMTRAGGTKNALASRARFSTPSKSNGKPKTILVPATLHVPKIRCEPLRPIPATPAYFGWDWQVRSCRRLIDNVVRRQISSFRTVYTPKKRPMARRDE